MDDLSVYSEKKLANFETNYRESILGKPQEVSVSITAAHIFGQGYICEQVGTKEDDPTYSRFVCGYDEITKIYINNNNKNSPIYIQCDQNKKGIVNRRRIILPSFANNDEIVNMISSAKSEFDKKLEKQRESEKSRKIQQIEDRKTKEHEELARKNDEEFEKLTSNYVKAPLKFDKAEDAAAARIDELLEFDNFIEQPVVETKPAPAPIPEPKPAPAPIPEPKPAPAPIPEPKPAPAPIPEPKPAPAPIPEPKPAPAPIPEPKPAPAPIPEPKPAPAPIPEPKPAHAPIPEPKPVIEASDGMSLVEFETAVKKLKTMLDNGVITKDEFNVEKAKLLKFLY